MDKDRPLLEKKIRRRTNVTTLTDSWPVIMPTNRKYLGSKFALSNWIVDIIENTVGVPDRFLDGFTGTGSVAAEMSRRGTGDIICIDNLLSNTVILRTYFDLFELSERDLVHQQLAEFQKLPGTHGYFTENFGDRYFTRSNARRIDAVREEIAALAAGGESVKIIRSLLASLLLGTDRAANTMGQYDAYLKNLGQPVMSGKHHLVDSRVYQPLQLLPVATASHPATVITADLLNIISQQIVDVAYFDPPYNMRQYCDNYHVLENLARWEQPPVSGKTRKFPRQQLKSPFSKRTEVHAAFMTLLDGCQASHIYISYSSEGLIAETELMSLLERYGTVARWDFHYPVFGHGAGVAKKRTVIEYLFELHRG